ncbi:hypothetical protein H0A36_14600 [Endozoicomonas sp. SM1973]|uniref:Uncharacterized protein n=1 Tax=Spartinivicinus marinus TaxID=2994442 RepID=A0A853IDI6_9GAMM|nr:hypothetical protein [Spartinivicinus marinus]MCX4028578.1 hypothetical protein [Spartinivicinus marinus]NYZ67245.1 hypothetical protein [Spartinivicinus marinus]
MSFQVIKSRASRYIHKNTIINNQFDHTSFIKTMCNKWNLEGLTNRDKHANSFEQVFSSTKRKDAWPDIPEPIPNYEPKLEIKNYFHSPLNSLQKSMLHFIIGYAKQRGVSVDQYGNINIQTLGEAIPLLKEISTLFFSKSSD